MEITCTNNMRNLIIKIKGDIDHHSTEEIREKTDREYNRSNAKNIIFDFSDVSFMDSSGIGMVMGRYKNIADKGGKVVIAGINNEINRIFELSGLYKILPSTKNIEEAIKFLA